LYQLTTKKKWNIRILSQVLKVILSKYAFGKFFVLPDYEVKRKGYAVDKIDSASLEERILLDKERISIPELLFNPSDIGLN
jgi:hypothetical protein